MLASGLVWPSKWVGRPVRTNWMHRHGLDGHPKKIGHFWRQNPDHPKNGLLYHTKIIEMRCMLTSGLVWPSKWVGRAVRANRMLRQGHEGVHQKFGIFDVGIWITQKMVCYSTRKSSKWGVCSLQGLFDIQKWSEGPWGHTGCIDKVLTDVHKKIWHF